MKEALLKLLGTVALDELLMTVYAIVLFWALLVTARSHRFGEFFKEKADDCMSIRRLLASYAVVAYTTYVGYIAVNKNETPDIPTGVIMLVLVLLGLLTAEKIADRFTQK